MGIISGSEALTQLAIMSSIESNVVSPSRGSPRKRVDRVEEETDEEQSIATGSATDTLEADQDLTAEMPSPKRSSTARHADSRKSTSRASASRNEASSRKRHLPTPREAREELHRTRKPRRFRPGTRALREIRFQQRQTNTVIPHGIMFRVIREIAMKKAVELGLDGVRFQASAIQALHEASEDHIVQVFMNTMDITANAHRMTIMPRDLRLAVKHNHERSAPLGEPLILDRLNKRKQAAPQRHPQPTAK